MKKVLINTRVLAIALAATFATAFSSPALAIDEKKAIPAELKLISNNDSQPVFELSINNAEENNYLIVIRDENNNELFRDNIKAGNITRKFRLNTEEFGYVKFEITGNKTEKPLVFEINRNSSIVEELVINRIK